MEDEVQEQPEQAGAATKLAQQVGQGLQKLSEMLASSNPDPQDSAQMKQIMDLYIDLVEKKLAGGEPEPVPEGMGQVPVDAGPNGIPMGPQSRQ